MTIKRCITVKLFPKGSIGTMIDACGISELRKSRYIYLYMLMRFRSKCGIIRPLPEGGGLFKFVHVLGVLGVLGFSTTVVTVLTV